MAPAEGELLAATAWRRRRVLGEPVAAYGQRILGEPHLEGVLPAREAEPAYVLAGRTGRAVLEAVAEEERISCAQPRVEEQLGDQHSGVVVPAHPSRAAVFQGSDRRALRGATGITVVDRHIAVHTVLVGPHDVVGLAREQLAVRAYPDEFVVAEGVQPAVER